MRIVALLLAVAAASLFLQGLLFMASRGPEPHLILRPATWAMVAFVLAGLRLGQMVIGRVRRS